MATQIVLYVLGRTTDVSRTVPSTKVTLCITPSSLGWPRSYRVHHKVVFTASERMIAMDFTEKFCFLAWITTWCSRLLLFTSS